MTVPHTARSEGSVVTSTCVVSSAALSPGTRSVAALTTVALLVNVPEAPGCTVTTSVKFVLAPAARVPIVQVTVPSVSDAGTLALSNVVLDGSGSVTMTSVASLGPALVQVSV